MTRGSAGLPTESPPEGRATYPDGAAAGGRALGASRSLGARWAERAQPRRRLHRTLGRLLLAASLTLVLLVVAVASATACPVLPATSKWIGPWKATVWIDSSHMGHGESNGEGTWRAEVTAVEQGAPGSGNYLISGPGEVEVRPSKGPAAGQTFHFPGELEAFLECTSATTDSIRLGEGFWRDERFGPPPARQGVDEVEGNLEINSVGAVMEGGWGGDGIYHSGPTEREVGFWEGEFKPTAQSRGPVKGKLELASPSGTLSTLETELASHLPLLPSNYFAPVGGVHFTIQLGTGVGAAKVKLTLPPGSNPTRLLKLVGGTYTEVPATISGDEIEYELTDGGSFDEDGMANGQIVDPVVPVHKGPDVTTSALPEATHGVAYSAELAVAGGTPPYKWKKVGKLPKKLKLTKNGVISGVPSAAGSYPVTVKVTDAKKESATVTLTLKVA